MKNINKDKEITLNNNDSDRNKCIESLCQYKIMIDYSLGLSWKQCIRCGRKKDLEFRV